MTPDQKKTLAGLAGYYTVIIVFGLISGWPERWSHRPIWLTILFVLVIFVVAPWCFHRRRMRNESGNVA